MITEDLEEELRILEDSVQNLRMEIDVSHKPSRRLLLEHSNAVKMRDAVADRIEEIMRLRRDPEVDYGKTAAYDALVSYYAEKVRIKEKHCRTLLDPYKEVFSRAYDD